MGRSTYLRGLTITIAGHRSHTDDPMAIVFTIIAPEGRTNSSPAGRGIFNPWARWPPIF